MSTLQTTNLKNPSSASNNIVLGTGGDTTVTNNLTVSGTGNHSIAGTLQFNSGYGSAATAYGCRAWVNFDGTTATPSTRRGSGNVSSVTKNGTGNYTVNFTTALADANYSMGSSCSYTVVDNTSRAMSCAIDTTTSPTTGLVRITCGYVQNSNSGSADPSIVNVQIFR